MPESLIPALPDGDRFYQPPYERSVEDELVWHLIKYLSEDAGLLYQQQIKDARGAVVGFADFVVVVPGGHSFAIEVTGAREGVGFGVPVWQQDEVLAARDARMVETGLVSALYRAHEDDATSQIHDVLYLVARYEPQAFSARGHECLSTLASLEAVSAPRKASGVTVVYEPGDNPFDRFESVADPLTLARTGGPLAAPAPAEAAGACDECAALGRECPACERGAVELAVAMLPSGRMMGGGDLTLADGDMPY